MGLTKLICCIRIVMAIYLVLAYILYLNDCLHYDSNNGVLHRKILNCNLNVACGWGTCMCDSARAYLLKRALTAGSYLKQTKVFRHFPSFPWFRLFYVYLSPLRALVFITIAAFIVMVPIGLIFSIYDSTEVVIQKMIEASQRIITVGRAVMKE